VEVVGVDVYLDYPPKDAGRLVEGLRTIDAGALALTGISSRGLKIWPDGPPDAFCTDVFRCRFMGQPGIVTQQHIMELLGRLSAAGLVVGAAQTLRNFNGAPGYTPAEGE
jgi:isocitrate dehydrogenase